MDVERKGAEGFRELRLEGGTLLVAGALLIGLLSGAFYLGRRVERAIQPEVATRSPSTTPVSTPERESLDRVSYFDHLEGREKSLEPARQAEPPPVAVEPVGTATEAAPPPPETVAGEVAEATGSGGPFVVQVFAGRDREAAESLVGKLGGLGYEASLRSEPEGSGELIRVRVTGYETEDRARVAAQELQKLGYSTWVRREDG